MEKTSLLRIFGFIPITNDMIEGQMTESEIKNISGYLWDELISDICYRLDIGDSIDYTDLYDKDFNSMDLDGYISETIHSLIETEKLHIIKVNFELYEDGQISGSGYDYVATLNIDLFTLYDQYCANAHHK